jgi:CRP/FNR family transcriptional regulator, cyclic AMP receptor protein
VTRADESAAELLARIPLFSELSQKDLDRIARVAVPRTYPRGTRVFHEGDSGDACYVIRSGSCRVTRQHSDGRAITLANLVAQDIFGELAMLDGELRSASVETLEDTELLALPARDMRALLNSNPEITVKLVVALTRRLRSTNERISRQSFQTVPSRVAGVLSQLVAEEVPARGEGVTIRMNQVDLAQLAGTSRECVSWFLAEV